MQPGDWKSYGIRLLRFEADRSDTRRLRSLEARLRVPNAAPAQRAASLSEIDLNGLVGNRVNSTKLLTYLARHTADFDAIIFFNDYSGLTLRGWRIAAARTVVVGSLADSADAYLLPTSAMMLGAARICLETEDETALARRLYGPGILARSTVLGDLRFDDPSVVERLREILSQLAEADGRSPRFARSYVVHRLARAEYGESATLLALQLDALLRKAGYRSYVVSEHRDYRLGAQVKDPGENTQEGAISITYGSRANFGAGPGTIGAIVLGAELPVFEGSGSRVQIPPFLDAETWGIEPLREVIEPLEDGWTNLLCVGDVHAANRILELVEVFRHYVTMDFRARLVVAGPHVDERYVLRVREYVDRCGLSSRVQLPGTVSQPALAAMYRTARAFVSLRDCYETGLSLLEAMAFDIPICVRATPSARAVTGGKTILFSGLPGAFEVAALWRVVASDEPLRDHVVASQRSHLASLTPDRTRRALEEALGLSPEFVRA
jgi:glycosyltransferase involved in cell wall biosynthesis